MECTASLQQGLVDPSTTSNDTNGSASRSRDGLLGTTREPDSCLVIVRGVTNDCCIVAGGTSESTTVADLLLDIADDGTFRALGDGEDVADVEGGLLAAVDEGTSVESLGGDESLLTESVAVWVTENDAGEGSTTAVGQFGSGE